jgi:hypothetical protein
VEKGGGIPILVKHAKGEVSHAHKDIALLALNKLAVHNSSVAARVQELTGEELWSAVQVAQLPGAAQRPAPNQI